MDARTEFRLLALALLTCPLFMYQSEVESFGGEQNYINTTSKEDLDLTNKQPQLIESRPNGPMCNITKFWVSDIKVSKSMRGIKITGKLQSADGAGYTWARFKFTVADQSKEFIMREIPKGAKGKKMSFQVDFQNMTTGDAKRGYMRCMGAWAEIFAIF